MGVYGCLVDFCDVTPWHTLFKPVRLVDTSNLHYLTVLAERFPESHDGILRRAAYIGSLDLCQWAAKHCLLTRPDKAFITAARQGHLVVCQWMVQFFDLHRKCHYRKALESAATNGHLSVCKMLRDHYRTTKVYTALMNTVIRGHLNVCQWLLGTPFHHLWLIKLPIPVETTFCFAQNCVLPLAQQHEHRAVCDWLLTVKQENYFSIRFINK